MLTKLKNKIIFYRKQLFLDKNEKFFFDNKISNSFIKKKIIFECFNDYYTLLMFKTLIKENFPKENFFGIWPHVIHPYPHHVKNYFSIIHTIKNLIFFSLIKRKWLGFYENLGISNIIKIDNIKYKDKISLKKNAYKIFINLKNKKDVLKIKINCIPVGDLIYDTYLRFKSVPTLDIKDKFLFKIIYKAIVMIHALNKFYKLNPVEIYFTSYSSYIHHGIPVRFFLNKKVKVYSCVKKYLNNSINRLTLSHYRHSKNFLNFKNDFEKLKNKNIKIRYAKSLLNKKFKGINEKSAINLKVNTYKLPIRNYKYFDNINGVLFLHDFFDAPHDLKFSLFEDFYEWAIFTLDFIEKHNLKIGVKFHPNTKPESLHVNNYLKSKYKNIIWIDTKISNLSLFNKKNIKFGVSVGGTVLHELVFYKKYPIYLAENPISSFKIVPQINSLKAYKDALINGHKKKISKKSKIEICKLYYMYIVNQKNASNINIKISNEIDLKAIKDTSYDFFKFNKMIEAIKV
tara:strand:- start:3269 stop:4810 length:1542 start_codon:yes stop_codon:yes gene_type:complete